MTSRADIPLTRVWVQRIESVAHGKSVDFGGTRSENRAKTVTDWSYAREKGLADLVVDRIGS